MRDPRPISERACATLDRAVSQAVVTQPPHAGSKDGVPSRGSPLQVSECARVDASIASQYPSNFALAPAVRAHVSKLFQSVAGMFLLSEASSLASWLPQAVLLPADAVGAIETVAIGTGCVFVVSGLVRFYWARASSCYRIDLDGVQQEEWFFANGRPRRRAPRVMFAHLRSVECEQSLWQMALNVGTIRLAAGGTDGYEVQLRDVVAPKALQAEFQRRHCASSSRISAKCELSNCE